nr:hypothetical protein OG461_11915 [Streptomyces sp. NBC_00995]
MVWRRSLRGSTAVAALLVSLAGCSSSTGGDVSAVGHNTSEPAARQPGSDPTADAPAGAEVLGTVRVGEPFTVTVLATNTTEDPNRWKFTVQSVVCGNPLDPAVMADAADSVGEPTATPAPEEGKQFCVLTMNAVNVGHAEDSWEVSNHVSLNVGDTQYTESDTDADHALDYAQYWQGKGKVGPAFGLNPGSRGPVHGVFQIPTGDEPTSVWVTSGTAIETIDGMEPGYLVRLT